MVWWCQAFVPRGATRISHTRTFSFSKMTSVPMGPFGFSRLGSVAKIMLPSRAKAALHPLDDAVNTGQRDVFQNVRRGQRDVRRRDPHRRAVEIVKRLVSDDRDKLRAPAAQSRILLDREQPMR